MKKITFVKGNIYVEGDIKIKNGGDVTAFTKKNFEENDSTTIINDNLNIKGDLIVDDELYYATENVFAFYKKEKTLI